MEYLIVIIIGVVVIWAVYAASNNAKKKKEQEEASNAAELKIRLTGDEPVKKTVVTQATGQESLDSVYARNNGLWMCNRCETLNSDGQDRCVACGRRRN